MQAQIIPIIEQFFSNEVWETVIPPGFWCLSLKNLPTKIPAKKPPKWAHSLAFPDVNTKLMRAMKMT